MAIGIATIKVVTHGRTKPAVNAGINRARTTNESGDETVGDNAPMDDTRTASRFSPE
jgi:hypothetical protein